MADEAPPMVASTTQPAGYLPVPSADVPVLQKTLADGGKVTAHLRAHHGIRNQGLDPVGLHAMQHNNQDVSQCHALDPNIGNLFHSYGTQPDPTFSYDRVGPPPTSSGG
jgi:hypothetical protein